MIQTLAVSGYRSLRDLVISLGQLTVVTGANGSGKSSLYRSMRLLSRAADGTLIRSLAVEGGIDAVRWAGPETISPSMRVGTTPVQGTRRRQPVRLALGVAAQDYGFALDLGLPAPSAIDRFPLDPSIKAEAIWAGPLLRPAAALVERTGPAVRQRSTSGGAWESVAGAVTPHASVLTEFTDPRTSPEVVDVRRRLAGWRFYDHLRTDELAPARQAHLATRTPVMAADGADVASALATIEEIGRADVLAAAIDGAFPGSTLMLQDDAAGRVVLGLRQPGLLRPLTASELSDGTLRYLMLAAALLPPRPPELLVLNEPETSLHPDLLGPLATLIHEAAQHAQIIVVSHDAELAQALQARGADHVELRKDLGETVVAGREGALDRPSWVWPTR